MPPNIQHCLRPCHQPSQQRLKLLCLWGIQSWLTGWSKIVPYTLEAEWVSCRILRMVTTTRLWVCVYIIYIGYQLACLMQSGLAMPATRHEQEPPGSSQTWLEQQWPASLAPRCWLKLLNRVIHLESPHSGWNTTGWLLKSPPFPSFSPACSLQPPWAAPHWLAMAAKNRKTSPAETFVGLFCITMGVKTPISWDITDPYSYGYIYIYSISLYIHL